MPSSARSREPDVRLTELLGSNVVTSDGSGLGRVHDVHLVQDGPVLGEWGAAFRVHDLVVGTASYGTRLGYRHGGMSRPFLVRLVFASRRPRTIPWSAVRSFDPEEKQIVVDAISVR
jgi:hypothetical protein